MPTKKELAALLSETPQQPLRRGRGLRLSSASKQAWGLASKPSVSPEPSTLPEPSATVAPPSIKLAAAAASAETPIALDAVAAQSDAVAAAPIESAAAPDPESLKPERDKRKLQLRKDLLKQCKRIARAQDRKLYQVIEAALEEYIQRYGAHE
jgi:hypothetical protein